MTLSSQLSSDIESVFFNTSDFAVSVSYTASGESAATIPALIDYGEGAPMEGMDPLNTDAVMDILVSDIITVTPGDSVAIGSDTWNVTWAKKIDDGLMWRCYISRRNR